MGSGVVGKVPGKFPELSWKFPRIVGGLPETLT